MKYCRVYNYIILISPFISGATGRGNGTMAPRNIFVFRHTYMYYRAHKVKGPGKVASNKGPIEKRGPYRKEPLQTIRQLIRGPCRLHKGGPTNQRPLYIHANKGESQSRGPYRQSGAL